ncbi:uncharacterized protein DUF3868 [Dysgonomonas alginatilytica]|uniref:Uncharacterized protein DUF3868 n=1 Tax=Dysgonomonas alginatilytica TaxID=1605892 RepID=A0A2V3PIQ4_9BACT|nr:DUF3868 domain-containing protein [Dysgonomonas alginatilytica]PXV59436.1 uncharacterized protein DUF3868 [Dysgonomonas alginatilytica]
MILNKLNIHTVVLLVLFALLSGNVQAQQKAHISLNNQTIARQGDSLRIALTIQAKNVQLNSDQSLRLELTLEDADKCLVLPCMIYTGNRRYKYDRRNELLAGKPMFAKGSVYKTIRPIDKNTAYVVDYTLTIPYQTWMDHASINAVQLFHDCCNESAIASQVLVTDVNISPRKPIEPPKTVWTPDPKVYTQMVSFLTPPVEEVKNRVATVSARLNYPVNVYKVLPDFKNNPVELQKVDSLMQTIIGTDIITLGAMRITGYASPEGTYKSNELLAQRRSKGFADYIKTKYRLGKLPVHTDWIAEDWDGLVDLVNDREMSYKQEVLDLIAGTDIFDARERKLMMIGGGNPYKEMKAELFPLLRRIELRVDYIVEKLSDSRAKELLYTRPELLSLDEMYHVALYYAIGSEQYREVYEIAAKQYPNDLIANNNAAAALLLQGNTKEAAAYLDKIKNNPLGLINKGVSAYIQGDFEQAKHLFEQAKLNGYKEGDVNLFLIQPHLASPKGRN